jgi:type IX secretion system PorP/SprF family membrane protein
MKQLIVIAFLFVSAGLARAQHNDFQSLYMYDALTVNPAYAGMKGALTLNANYRDQWGGIKGSPRTFSFTGHLVTRSQKNGLGLTLMNDRFGLYSNLKANAVYAYRIRVKKSVLSLGLSGGIRQQTIARDELNLNAADDDAFTQLPAQQLVPDVAFGILFRNRYLMLGASAPNIVRLDDATTLQAVNGYAGVLIGLGESFKLKPTTLVKYAVHSPLTVDANLTAYYRNNVSFGGGWRNNQAANFHVRLQLNGQLGIGYLFERNYGPTSSFLRNTHEFMINYIFDYRTNVQSPRYF